MSFTEEVQREFDDELLHGDGYATRGDMLAAHAAWGRRFMEARWLDAFDTFVKQQDLLRGAVQNVLSRPGRRE